MPLLLYCVFLADNAKLPETGVEGRRVHQLDLDRLTVIYSDLGTSEISGDKFKSAALRFHEVVHAVFDQRAVIPFRFPTFLNEAELRGHLQKESEQYLNFLRAHAEDAQMEVRIWRNDTAQPKPAGGTEYMARLLEHKMLLQHAAREVQNISAHLVRDWKESESRDAIRLFALMTRERIDSFREALAERLIQEAHTQMRVTGPWPATEFFAGSAHRLPQNVVSIRSEDIP